MSKMYQRYSGETIWVPEDEANGDYRAAQEGRLIECDEQTGQPLPGEVERVGKLFAADEEPGPARPILNFLTFGLLGN